MNTNIQKLYRIAEKESRVIVGLMSGTSLDGLDIALCLIRGVNENTQVQLLAFESLPYSLAFREEIKVVFSKATVSTEMLCAMNAKIGIAHAELVNTTLKKWNINRDKVDVIASHGQTVYHAPQSHRDFPNSTLQIGDGDHIAVHTGIITLSDFRQKHVASGGEGAPLVIYGDFLLFGHSTENRILLNIGGISNFTFLPAGRVSEGVFATDIGPGNTLMNQFAQMHFGQPYDEDGRIAASGRVNTGLLDQLIKHEFFAKASPKTTGPEMFNLDFLDQSRKESGTERLVKEDVMATLMAFTVLCISQSLTLLQKKYGSLYVYVSGGGYRNPVLMDALIKKLTDISIQSTAVLGMDPDAKEAVLFALLANQTLAGKPIGFKGVSGAPEVSFGKISLPD